jgi:RNA-binding motif protein, X-linked 2
MGRMLRVDHTRYKKGDHEVEGDTDTKGSRTGAGELAAEAAQKHKVQSTESDEEAERPMLKEERELNTMIRDHDDDDPMKAFLIEEKREEVLAARMRQGASKSSRKKNTERRHHKPHRTRDRDYYAEEMRSSLRRREERNHSRSMSKDSSYKDSGAYDCVEDKRSSRSRGDNRAPSKSRSNDRYAKWDG